MEDTNETVQASDQAVYHLGFDPDRGTIDPDRALLHLPQDGNEVLTLAFYDGLNFANSGSYIFKCYPEILPPGYPDHTDLPGLRISAGIHYLQIFRKGAELSDPYGHHSHVDQHASPYLCMDEHSF